MSTNYDFEYYSRKGYIPVSTACVLRRFIASYLDFFYILAVLLLFGKQGESDIDGLYNFALVLSLSTLPEFLLRQTPGMIITGMVVVVPPNENPLAALFVRKIINLVEVCLPSFIYYFMVSVGKEHKSLSDMASHCEIKRKKFILEENVHVEEIGDKVKFFIAAIFSALPIMTLVVFMFSIAMIFENSETFEFLIYLLSYFVS